jgi:hypothetical protein
MSRSKKSIMAALVAATLALGAGVSMADTITVTNGAAPTIVSGGSFNGDQQFNYIVSFSPTANVSTGDGFLIADFGAVAGFTFTGSSGNAPASTLFTESTPSGGGVVLTGLNGEVTSSLPGFDEFTGGGATDFIPDAASVGDVAFIDTGSGTFVGTGTGSGGTLDLTIYSTNKFVNLAGDTIGVDHSGSGNVLNPDPSSVAIPSPTAVGSPLPASSLGGGLLIALLAGLKLRKARQLA